MAAQHTSANFSKRSVYVFIVTSRLIYDLRFLTRCDVAKSTSNVASYK